MADPGEAASGHRPGLDPDTHLTIVAVLTLLGGTAVFLGGLAASWWVWAGSQAGTAFLGPFGWFVPGILGPIVGLIFGAAVLLALPAILGGLGIVRRAEWGRVLTFVTAVGVGLFALASFTLLPLAYTAYAVWVLTREPVVARFDDTAG